MNIKNLFVISRELRHYICIKGILVQTIFRVWLIFLKCCCENLSFWKIYLTLLCQIVRGGGGGQIKCTWGKLSRFLKMGFILGHCFIMIKWTSGLFSWNVEFGHSPTVRHKRACWVDNNENIQPNKFSKPIGQYISHSYWKQFFCLKLPFLGSNQHLFVWIHQY